MALLKPLSYTCAVCVVHRPHFETASCPPLCAGTFTNATTGAPFAAAWAAAPDAVMYATRDGSVLKALLKLSNPAYDVKAGQLAFSVSVLPADAQRLTLSGGATARVRSLQ